MQIRSFMGLKIWYSQGCAGSIPVPGTILSRFFKTRSNSGFFSSIRYNNFSRKVQLNHYHLFRSWIPDRMTPRLK
jgi:hypothetical protein